jgi:Fur family ferric uptake transcriptional regulator
MATPVPLYLQKLKDHRRSDTTARRAVFRVITNHTPAPISMNELLRELEGKIDRASAYRAIELFEALGIIKKIYTGWKYKLELGDEFHDHHHHMNCIGCGRIIALQDTKLEQKIATLGDKNHFKIIEHQLEIRGYCEHCKPYR